MKHQEPKLLSPKISYETFADRLLKTMICSEPWVGHKARFHHAPIVLPSPLVQALYQASEALCLVYEELVQLVQKETSLLETFFGLTPFQRLMWHSTQGAWHGFARFDLFLCEDGQIQMTEINADTPTGQSDTCVAGSLVTAEYPGLYDLNANYKSRFLAMLDRVYQVGVKNKPMRVGLLYPTDLTEDLPLIRLYQIWLESKGVNVVLGAPYNLRLHRDGSLLLLDEPVTLLLRHYKTDWWGERIPVWQDAPFVPDPDPLQDELLALIEADRLGTATIVNPMGSILPQNKIAMAFCWERIEAFSKHSQKIIRAYIPETYRLETVNRQKALLERESWVLKSNFGCEGDEVFIGKKESEATWKQYLDSAAPNTWVLQRFFSIKPLDSRWLPNYGVYVIAGKASGVYVRLDVSGEHSGLHSLVAPPFTSHKV